MYLEVLKKYKQKYGFKLFAFALMPNQLNLLMGLKEGSTISMVMHDINSSYTKYFNGRYARKGHLFRERFKSVVAEKGPYLLNLMHYVHERPLRLGLARTLDEFNFSSHPLYLYNYNAQHQIKEEGRLVRNSGLNLDSEIKEVNGLIARLAPEKKDYLGFIAQVPGDEMEELAEKLEEKAVLGSLEFIQSIEEELKKKAEGLQARSAVTWRPVFVSAVVILIAGTAVGGLILSRNSAKTKEAGAPVNKEEKPAPLTGLDGTVWVVELKADGTQEGAYPPYDKVIFKQGTVSVAYLAAKGFSSSNYAVNFNPDGLMTWETMQRNSRGDVAFLKGEVTKDGKMKGVFTRRPKEGEPEHLSFSSLSYKQGE